MRVVLMHSECVWFGKGLGCWVFDKESVLG